MKSLATHTERLASFLALLFLAANAGYTVVLEYCTTECVAVCSMETCADQMAFDMSSGDTMPARDIGSVQVESECHKVTIAGGLNFIPMVSETALEGQTSTLDVLSSAAARNVVPPETPRISHCSSLPAGDARQYAVERYVLHASFLM
ncbi:MAG: hypothetical protein WBG01_00850 [Bacteroidota bacterium]